jgi:hypothetical protein
VSVPPAPAPPLPPPHQRNGCMTALAIAIGLVMLLPGVCALILAGFDPKEVLSNSSTLFAFLTFLAIGAGGIALIWWAVRQQR